MYIHTYVSIRQHTSAYVSTRQHMSACVSIRQHTSAYVSIRQHTRQHTSAYTSAYVSIPDREPLEENMCAVPRAYMRPSATSVGGLQLIVHEALSYLIESLGGEHVRRATRLIVPESAPPH
jgi:hypothetical protein